MCAGGVHSRTGVVSRQCFLHRGLVHFLIIPVWGLSHVLVVTWPGVVPLLMPMLPCRWIELTGSEHLTFGCLEADWSESCVSWLELTGSEYLTFGYFEAVWSESRVSWFELTGNEYLTFGCFEADWSESRVSWLETPRRAIVDAKVAIPTDGMNRKWTHNLRTFEADWTVHALGGGVYRCNYIGSLIYKG